MMSGPAKDCAAQAEGEEGRASVDQRGNLARSRIQQPVENLKGGSSPRSYAANGLGHMDLRQRRHNRRGQVCSEIAVTL
jgi:hypothetical protein